MVVVSCGNCEDVASLWCDLRVWLRLNLISSILELRFKIRFYILSPGACANPLGLGWDYKLPDSAFSASSEMTPGKK